LEPTRDDDEEVSTSRVSSSSSREGGHGSDTFIIAVPDAPRDNLPFIDAHCHLFNILDVPLYESLSGKIKQGTIQRLLLAFAAGPAVLIGAPEQLLLKYHNFITFFENDIRDNIHWLEKQLNLAFKDSLVKAYFGASANRLVMTPLAMDFDTNLDGSDLGSERKRCIHQIERLFSAIQQAQLVPGDSADTRLEIYPFMGFALNKLDHHPGCLQDLKDWWGSNGLTAAQRSEGFSKKVQPGKAIGIKLYPPLGFNPCPERLPNAYLEFYSWCVDMDIPLAVHCQESSFCVTPQQNAQANHCTHPRNWERLFSNHPHLAPLRINFGHFGGECQIAKLVTYGDNNTPVAIDPNSWSYSIIRLLKNHPNTYADLAAFDYSQYDCLNSLGMLLAGYADTLPDAQDLSAVLQEKLLWGTDVPMIISTDSFVENGVPSYAKLMKSFILSNPDASQQGVYKKICQNIARTNPSHFLFGQTVG
jgi:hypothetical protein